MTASGTVPAPDPARLLLDTHTFLWWAEGADERISASARAAVAGASTVYVSLASAWELTIKATLGKMRLGVTFAHALAINEFTLLPVVLDHVDRVGTLPLHHRDPFDRMLVAQAAHEGLTLVTHDRQLAPYAVPILWT